MKVKTLVGCIVGLTVAYVGSAFGISLYAENIYRNQIKTIRESLIALPEITIKESSYQRGLFSSSARTVLQWDQEDSTSIRIVMDDKIQIGPWLGGVTFGLIKEESVINFDPTAVSPQFTQALNGQNFISARTTVGFTTNFTSEIYSPAIDADTPEMQIRYNGFVANMSTSSFGKKADINFNFPYLNIKETDRSTFLLNNLTGYIQDLPIGDAAAISPILDFKIQFDNLHYTADDGTRILELNKARFINESHLNGKMLDGRTAYEFSGSYLGKPLAMQMVIKVKNFNYPAYQAMMVIVQKQDAQAMRRFFEDNGWVDFLKTSPIFEIEPFVIEYAGERASMTMRTSIGQITADDAKMRPEMLIARKANIRINIQIPQSFLTRAMIGDEVYGHLQDALKKGIFMRIGNMYVMNFELGSGRMDLNGKSMRY